MRLKYSTVSSRVLPPVVPQARATTLTSRMPNSKCRIRRKGHGCATLAGEIFSAAAAATIYRSILNPIFSLTWNSSTLPSLILPLSSAT